MDKPFKTHDELIALMNNRGLSTDKFTKYILEREGYYAVINGYKEPFLNQDLTKEAKEDVFFENASFHEIYILFVMDRRLRNILFRYITIAEATLKSITTYEFCKRHTDNNEAYLIASNYRNDRNYPNLVNVFIDDLNRILGRGQKKPKYLKEYLRHYIGKHDNVPLWVVMNNLSLGQTFKFYDFQNESIRFNVAQRFQDLYSKTHYGNKRITHKDIRKAYDHIKDFRNMCAHDERLYCSKVDKSKSTDFHNVVDDLQLVLSNNQYKSLLGDIMNALMEASGELHTIDLQLILSKMGYKSLDELRPVDK